MDTLLRWYNRLPAKGLAVAVVAAFALVAAFQTFASSGEYQAGSSNSGANTVWSAPGRYFLDCQPVDKGQKCLNPPKNETTVYAQGNYAVTYQTINLPGGAYTLKLQYQNVGAVPPGYSYSVRILVNGQPIAAGSDGTFSLPTSGQKVWSSDVPVTLPEGVSNISIQWLNAQAEGKGRQANFGISQVGLVSKQASEAAAKRDDQRRQDLDQYREALSRYIADTGKYPEQSTVLGMTQSNQPFAVLAGKYLPTFLTDPSEGHAYYFIGNGSRYGLCADLESEPGTRYEVGPSGSRQTKGSAKACTLLN